MQNEEAFQRPAVFLDRDGTINEESGYVNHISRFKLLKESAYGIRLLNEAGFLVFVVSNQSGAAKGYFPEKLIDEVNAVMLAELSACGAKIDKIYYCPHSAYGKVDCLRMECDCRKPKTGMVKNAMLDFDIDISKSFVIGDRLNDIAFAHAAGLRGIMVKTGYGMGEIEYILPSVEDTPDYIAADLSDAAQWIINSIK